MKYFLEIVTPEQATTIQKLKPGDKVRCGCRIEEVTKVEIPSVYTKSADGEESKLFCMIGV